MSSLRVHSVYFMKRNNDIDWLVSVLGGHSTKYEAFQLPHVSNTHRSLLLTFVKAIAIVTTVLMVLAKGFNQLFHHAVDGSLRAANGYLTLPP